MSSMMLFGASWYYRRDIQCLLAGLCGHGRSVPCSSFVFSWHCVGLVGSDSHGCGRLRNAHPGCRWECLPVRKTDSAVHAARTSGRSLELRIDDDGVQSPLARTRSLASTRVSDRRRLQSPLHGGILREADYWRDSLPGTGPR